jgi:tetratricopeptide (TPR) repeat protein
MITNTNTAKLHDELIIEKEALCAQFESGNPLLENQNFLFTQKESKFTASKSVFDIPNNLKPDDAVFDFFKENLDRSLERERRLPKNPAIENAVALNYFRIGDIDKAIRGFENVLKRNKNYFQAIASLAECYAIKSDFKQALEIYKKYESKFKNDVRFLINFAILHFRDKDIEAALKFLSKAYKLDDKNPFVMNNLALVYLSKKNPGQAISLLRKASRINNNDYNIYNNLGVCFIAIRNLKKAIHFFKIAYSLNNLARNVIHNLTSALMENREYEPAILILSDYLEKNHADVEFRSKIAWCYFNLKLYKKCLIELKRSLSFVGGNDTHIRSSIYNNMAIVNEKLGFPVKTRQLYKKCLETDAEPDEIVYYNIIEFFLAHNEMDDSKQALDHALIKYPNDPILLNYLGRYYIYKSKYTEAKQCFEKVLSIDNKNADSFLGLSNLELEVYENTKNALKMLEQGIKLHPDNLAMINNYAYCQILLGNLKEARRALESVDSGDFVHMTATKGLLFIKEGDIESGRKHYNRAALLAEKDKKLQALVNQKKQLELSLHFLKNGNNKEALRRIKKGLKYQTNESYYSDKLLELQKRISF